MSGFFKFSFNLYRFGNQIVRGYAAKKKPPALTDAQIQFQKHTAELGFRERTSIRGTLYEFKDVETSIEYMQSEAFRKAYGDKKIWEWYIRNFKGRYPKSYTRKQCINVDLLQQFVSEDTGSLYPTSRTNVCRKQHENLEIAFAKACDHGLIDHPIQHRYYDYSLYYPELKETRTEEKPSVLLGVILGANRKSINNIFDELTEEDIILK